MKTVLLIILPFFLGAAACAQSIIKGPYLLYPNSNTAMTVMWQTDTQANSTFYWGTTQSYGNSTPVSEFGNDHQFKYTLQGLIPAQKYYYKVEVGSMIKTGSFITAPNANKQNLTFYIYGDTRAHPEVQNNVTGRILTEINNNPSSQTFCLITGDCVTHGRTENDWQNQFFNAAYSNNESLKSKIPYILARGNHENYNTNYNSGYASIFYKYWPYNFASNSTNGDDMYYSFDYGPVHIAVVDQYDNGSYSPAKLSSVQLNWLQNDLAFSNKTWKFILLHEPGWSAKYTSREHGNNIDVQNNIQPLCMQYDVKAVFGGHNHYYAHCKVDSVNHFTLGGGGAPLYNPSHTSGGVIVYAEATYHFMKVQITGDTAVLTAIKPDGSIIETTNLHIPTSGLNENIADKIKVYPNPSDGIINIQFSGFSNADLHLYDMSGREVLSKKITSNTNKINLSNFNKGVYVIAVSADNQIIRKKIVLK